MISDDKVDEMKDCVRACNRAREMLEEALHDADASGREAMSDPSGLEPVGAALENWRNAQERFMATIEASSVSNPATAALLLKTNHGIDASNARCGIPGTDVDGADQPFPLDLSGSEGMVLTQAATEHLS